jgi:type I restriction enzyme S subunit
MKSKLSDICHYVKGKVDVSGLDNVTYISTENMLPDKGGVTEAATLPNTAQAQIYEHNDVLVSNIRPYFKKIWFANQDGGCSNDVLVFRANEGVEPGFLYYVLADDKFFNYSMATSKGTKMPRGDKKTLMEYEVPDFYIGTQRKVASLLGEIDEKIRTNNEINKNLEQQAQAIYNISCGRQCPYGASVVIPIADHLQTQTGTPTMDTIFLSSFSDIAE